MLLFLIIYIISHKHGISNLRNKKLRIYLRSFKEKAIRLSSEIGVRKASGELDIASSFITR